MSIYRVFSGPYFPVLGLNTGKYGPEKTPYFDTFHAYWYLKKDDLWFGNWTTAKECSHWLSAFLIKFKTTNNSLSSSATRNLSGTSNQDSVGDKLTEACNSNTATISKHKNPTIRSSKQQSNNNQIKRKILVAGDSMFNNIYERGLSKHHTVRVKYFLGATTEKILDKVEKPSKI